MLLGRKFISSYLHSGYEGSLKQKYSICGEHGYNTVGNNNWCISQESQESQSFVKEFGLEALENKYK